MRLTVGRDSGGADRGVGAGEEPIPEYLPVLFPYVPECVYCESEGASSFMQLTDIQSLRSHSETPAEGVTITQLHPYGGDGNSLLAVDLLEVEAGAQMPLRRHAEEQVLFVVSGVGELSSGDGLTLSVRGGSVVSVSPLEAYSLRNTDNARLRVLVSSSLVARTARAFGVRPAPAPADNQEAQEAATADDTAPQPPVVEAVETAPEPARLGEDAQPPLDISSLMKRGSDVAARPRSEQRKLPAEPEQEVEPEEPPSEAPAEEGHEEDAPEQSNLMELQVVFDGGSRGNPGQGYGSYLVQSPGRRPVIKRVEFGDNYTNNQAEYDSLISALEYIVDRLTATGRTPAQVQLDIKTDSDLVVNQLTGAFKVKDASLRKRHDQANSLLSRFADWAISWHGREESVRLLGH